MKKHLRKLFCLVLAICLMASMAVMASAQGITDNGSYNNYIWGIDDTCKFHSYSALTGSTSPYLCLVTVEYYYNFYNPITGQMETRMRGYNESKPKVASSSISVVENEVVIAHIIARHYVNGSLVKYVNLQAG